MRVVKASPTRLEIAHNTTPLMLLLGLGCLVAAAKAYFDRDGSVSYPEGGLWVLMGLALGLTACHSHVTIDKVCDVLSIRHRYFFTTRYGRVELGRVEAVVISTDHILGQSLSVICVRVGGDDVPLTRFGSPFPAAVHRHAARIAAFLGLPLLEKERLVLEAPDDSAQDAIKDVCGKTAGRLLVDRTPAEGERGKGNGG